MPIDFSLLAHEGIQHLKPYKPGKSIASLAKEQGLTDIVKLASNENPLGCSPLVKEAIHNLSSQTIAAYPSPYIHPIMDKLAAHLELDSNQIIISNGSDWIYNLLLNAFALHQNKHLLTHEYAFSTYAIQAQSLGIPVKIAPIAESWLPDTQAILKLCNENTALICLANPNNPTGTLLKGQAIKAMLERIPPTTLLVLDEAYYEYSRAIQDYDALEWLGEHPNLVLTRTFSKAYGIAGLRLGYAIADQSVIEILRRLQLPFTINQVALNAGLAALNDQAFIKQSIAVNREGMALLERSFQQMNLHYIPSSGNFISFDSGADDHLLYEHLLSRGIIVRPLHPYNMNRFLRVTVGTSEQNQRFLTELGVYYQCQVI